MRYILHLVFLVFLMLGCSSGKGDDKNESWYKFINKTYQTNKSFFKPEFLNHFPDDLYSIDDIGRTVIGKKPGLECITFTQGVKYTKPIFDSISSSFINKSLKSYSSADTLFLVYNQFLNSKNVGFKTNLNAREKLILQRASDMEVLPVPNFWNYSKLDLEIAYNLPEDYIVYVIEAEAGKFWDDRYLMNKDLMPEKWKHGYSKGVAISTKRLEIAYWFIIW